MMIRTAGGPGLVSPLDYGERKRPLPRATWIAIGVVGLAHIGVGAALYYQRFEMDEPIADPLPPSVTITMEKPEPRPQIKTDVRPPAPNPPVHKAMPTPFTPPDTLPVNVVDNPSPNPGPVINLTTPVPPEAPVGVASTPTPKPPSVITRPDWVSQPSAAQMSRAFPERALGEGIGGAATLRCQVQVNGNLSGCAVANETPGGKGFGRAALGLTRYFRMSPRTVDGQAVDGAAVVFTVRFGVTD